VPSLTVALPVRRSHLCSYCTFNKSGSFSCRYATKVGTIFAVVMGIVATKTITMYRAEFFRDAASGYSVNAYFWAICFVVTVVHSFQAVAASLFAFYIRNSLAHWYTYVINFIMLSWISASWGMLFPFLVPEKYVIIVTAFLVAFFSLLFCGAITPISFEGA